MFTDTEARPNKKHVALLFKECSAQMQMAPVQTKERREYMLADFESALWLETGFAPLRWQLCNILG